MTAAQRLHALVARCEDDLAAVAKERANGDALADDVGGPDALRWRLVVLRALIAEPPEDDSVREVYGELYDRYRDEPDALAEIKPLGDEIRRLEATGALPSALVVRSDRRKR